MLLKYKIHINFKQEEIVTIQMSEAVHRYIARSFGNVSKDSLMGSQAISRGQELHSLAALYIADEKEILREVRDFFLGLLISCLLFPVGHLSLTASSPVSLQTTSLPSPPFVVSGR